MKLKLAELHVHLRGTIHPSLLERLARRNGIRSRVPYAGSTYSWEGFEGFLEAYHEVAKAIRTAEDYAEAAADYLSRAASDGTIYCELMVSPDHAADVGIPYRALVDGVTAGMDFARKAAGIESRMIITCVRHRGPECAVDLARQAASAPHPLVTGFGMAGDERCYRPRDFVRAFKIARDSGLYTTCHAGEFCGPEGIWETTSELGVSRIGHGVRCVEDRSLVRHLAENDIALEICPTSNVKLGVYTSLCKHPLPQLIRAGCRVTLNTDDPAHFDGSLLQEYRDAQEHFGFDDNDLARLTLNAIEAAFCDEATKTLLRRLCESDHNS